jgi:hypothetical protein
MDTEKQHPVRWEVNRVVLAPREVKSPSNPVIGRHRTYLLGVQTSNSSHTHTQVISEHLFSEFTIALKQHFRLAHNNNSNNNNNNNNTRNNYNSIKYLFTF